MTVGVMFGEMDIDPDALFVPMLDARRMEVYTAVYNLALEPIVKPTPLILSEGCFDTLPGNPASPLLLFGNGSDKARDMLDSPRVRFIDGIVPLATDMTALADRAFAQRDFLDLAYSTPRYLKEFQAIKPKKLF